jgi:hypothetical protein
MVSLLLLFAAVVMVAILVFRIRRRRRIRRLNQELYRCMKDEARKLGRFMEVGTIESLSYGLAGVPRLEVQQVCRNNIGWERIRRQVQDLRRKGVLQ